MPNAEHIKLLVDDLRTTKAKQVRHKLEYTFPDGTVGNCCLGRACRVAMANGVKVRTEQVNADGQLSQSEESYTRFDDEFDSLPESVQDFYRFDCANPSVVPSDKYYFCALSLLNDHSRMSFAEIADAVEATWLTKV